MTYTIFDTAPGEFNRTNNAIAKHVIETGHTIDCYNTKRMEKEKKKKEPIHENYWRDAVLKTTKTNA